MNANMPVYKHDLEFHDSFSNLTEKYYTVSKRNIPFQAMKMRGETRVDVCNK